MSAFRRERLSQLQGQAGLSTPPHKKTSSTELDDDHFVGVSKNSRRSRFPVLVEVQQVAAVSAGGGSCSSSSSSSSGAQQQLQLQSPSSAGGDRITELGSCGSRRTRQMPSSVMRSERYRRLQWAPAARRFGQRRSSAEEDDQQEQDNDEDGISSSSDGSGSGSPVVNRHVDALAAGEEADYEFFHETKLAKANERVSEKEEESGVIMQTRSQNRDEQLPQVKIDKSVYASRSLPKIDIKLPAGANAAARSVLFAKPSRPNINGAKQLLELTSSSKNTLLPAFAADNSAAPRPFFSCMEPCSRSRDRFFLHRRDEAPKKKPQKPSAARAPTDLFSVRKQLRKYNKKQHRTTKKRAQRFAGPNAKAVGKRRLFGSSPDLQKRKKLAFVSSSESSSPVRNPFQDEIEALSPGFLSDDPNEQAQRRDASDEPGAPEQSDDAAESKDPSTVELAAGTTHRLLLAQDAEDAAGASRDDQCLQSHSLPQSARAASTSPFGFGPIGRARCSSMALEKSRASRLSATGWRHLQWAPARDAVRELPASSTKAGDSTPASSKEDEEQSSREGGNVGKSVEPELDHWRGFVRKEDQAPKTLCFDEDVLRKEDEEKEKRKRERGYQLASPSCSPSASKDEIFEEDDPENGPAFRKTNPLEPTTATGADAHSGPLDLEDPDSRRQAKKQRKEEKRAAKRRRLKLGSDDDEMDEEDAFNQEEVLLEARQQMLVLRLR
eukprot:CAMPEP_0178988654 /NCGR_PEP_ID=MMETSP0795-20121207/3924_1 /TAXON_ID=88552 /ORGANISM="Amoebophrya sp., Strain Ameob2" /LENGTH=722 /DNA_ID=CAMNT_0020679939 /DNA_START=34 /DNA_END=2203 /DNA_ORIENTATION=-